MKGKILTVIALLFVLAGSSVSAYNKDIHGAIMAMTCAILLVAGEIARLSDRM